MRRKATTYKINHRMRFISRIKRIFSRSKPGAGQESSSAGPRHDMYLWDLPLTAPLAVSTVYRCVQLLSDSVAVLPLVYRRKKGNVFLPDSGSGLSYLLGVQPTPESSAHDWKKQIVAEVLLSGNAYIVPFYDPLKGDYSRLALCARGTVSHDTVTDTYMVSDSVNGIYGTYSAEDVIHIKWLTGHDPKRGVSVLTHARLTIAISSSGDRETLARIENGGDVRGIISNSQGVRGFGEYQDEELQKKALDLDQRFRNGERIASLGGDVHWQPISMSSADMQFLESRKFTVREICRFFGVHPSFVFDDTSNNYKSAEMANVAFLSNTLNPLLCKIEGEMLRKLFPPSLCMNRRVEFDRRALYACDLESKVNYTTRMLQAGLCTINEARQGEGMVPVEHGDMVLVSANLKSIGQLMEEGSKGIRK